MIAIFAGVIILIILVILIVYYMSTPAVNTTAATAATALPPTPSPPPVASLTQMPGITFSNISIASDGTIAGCNSAGNISYYSNSQWTTVPSGTLATLCVQNANSLYGCNAGQNIYSTSDWQHWNLISGAASQISVANDGTMMCIGTGGQMYQNTGAAGSAVNWTQITGVLGQISVGSATNICGILNGQLSSWNGSVWTQIAGNYKWVACTSDGNIWSIDSSGNVLLYVANGQWHTMYASSPIVQISAQNGTNIVGLDASGNVYKNF